MKIEMNIPQSDIFIFLMSKGYEIKSWLWQYEDETFPGGLSHHATWTFTATKPDEEQSEQTLFTKVFDKEVRDFFKEIK